MVRNSVLMSMLGIFLSLNVYGNSKKTLLISDIDDTIKVSHAIDEVANRTLVKYANLRYYFLNPIAFTGMSELYQSLVENQKDSPFKLVYVSNAPKVIQLPGISAVTSAADYKVEEQHKRFLKSNSFPEGEVLMRENQTVLNHKQTVIRRLLDQEKPEVLIMIGDNGEHDPEIYHGIYEEYKEKIQILTYIHQVYSTNEKLRPWAKLHQEQIGYATAFDVALELKKYNYITDSLISRMSSAVVAEIVSENNLQNPSKLKQLAFPTFKNCSEYRGIALTIAELSQLNEKVRASCKIAN